MFSRPLLVAAAAALLLLTGCRDAPQAPIPPPPSAEAIGAPFGVPAAAARYESQRRLPLDREIDTRASYRAAERHVAGMSRYSTAMGEHLPARLPRPSAPALRGKWKALGPGNIGGRMRTLSIDPTDPDTILIGGVSGGIWKTRDGGASWDAVGDGLQNVAVNSMRRDPGDADTVFVGTGEGYFREVVRGTGLPLRGGGIYRSTDGGDTWALLGATEGEDFWFVNDLEISAFDGDRIYAATRTGVWRSLDGGESWGQVLATDVEGGCLDLALRADRPDDTLFASCGTFERATVYRAEDAAQEAAFEAVLSEPAMGRTSLAIAPSDPDVIYAMAVSNRKGRYEQALHAVFRSSSGGGAGSWEARVRPGNALTHNTLMLHNAVFGAFGACGFGEDEFIQMGWYVNTLAVDPLDPDTVWAAGVDWFRSDDGGRNWGVASYWWASRDAPGYTHADQHVAAFHPDYDGVTNRVMYVGNDGGISRTDDARAPVATGPTGLCDPALTGMAWQSLNNGLEITQFYQGVPLPGGKAYLGGTQDNGSLLRRARTGLNGWTRVLGGDGGYVAVDPRDPDVMYVEFQFGQFHKSVDGGVNVDAMRRGLPPATSSLLEDRSNFLFITPFVMDPNDPDRLWIGGREIYRTDNGAALWERASRKLKNRSRVSALAVAEGDPDRVVAGTDTGNIFVTKEGTTADSATRWSVARPRQAWVSWVAIDPADPDTVYATYAGFGGPHVYRSRDFGATWGPIDGEGTDALPDIPVHTIVVDPDDPERLFVGTDLGVFVTTDGGATWAQEVAGFGNIVTESLTLQKRGKRRFLYAFTHGRGAWVVKVRPPR